MNKPNIDDLFKDKLAERDFPFDESAWEAAAELLDQALPVKQQKRPLYKWMIVSLILFIGLGVTLYQVNSSRPVAETAEPNTHNSDARATHENEKKDNSSSSTPNAIQSSTNNNHSQANPPASNTLKNTPAQTPSFTTDKAPNTTSNTTSNAASNTSSNAVPNTSSNATSTAKPSKGSATSIVASTKSTSTASPSPVSPASHKGPTNSKVNQTDNQPATPNSVQTPVVPPVSGTSSFASASPAPQQNSANASSNNNPVATTSGVGQGSNEPQATTANQAANTTAVVQLAENTVTPVAELRSTQILDAIALNALQSPGIVSNDRPEDPKLKSETQPILKRAKTLSYSVAVQAGAMYNMHQLAGSTTEQTNFINQRKAAEAATVTPSLGILASMHYKRWSLSTGINMGSWATGTNYNGTFLKDTSYHNVSVVDTTYLQRRYVYSIQTQQVLDSFFVQIHSTYQDTSLVVTQVDYSVSDASKLKQTMRSAYIELPLLLGYQFRFGRFGVGLQTGPAIGLIYKQQGYVLNEDLLGVGLLSASPLSSRKVQFNYLAAAQAEYQISPKISILLQGVYRQSLGSMHSDYTQRYRQFGLQAGLKYKF
jgi:hypothetical protein